MNKFEDTPIREPFLPEAEVRARATSGAREVAMLPILELGREQVLPHIDLGSLC